MHRRQIDSTGSASKRQKYECVYTVGVAKCVVMNATWQRGRAAGLGAAYIYARNDLEFVRVALHPRSDHLRRCFEVHENAVLGNLLLVFPRAPVPMCVWVIGGTEIGVVVS